MALTDQVVVSWVVTSSNLVREHVTLSLKMKEACFFQIIVVHFQVDTVTQPRSILTLRME